MSAKRPAIDLSALTSDLAVTMPEAEQRRPAPAPTETPKPAIRAEKTAKSGVTTANLEALAFKVSPAFRKRFRERAVAADLKLNELLFEALDAWEEKQGLKR